jgi:hypothetical protein
MAIEIFDLLKTPTRGERDPHFQHFPDARLLA